MVEGRRAACRAGRWVDPAWMVLGARWRLDSVGRDLAVLGCAAWIADRSHAESGAGVGQIATMARTIGASDASPRRAIVVSDPQAQDGHAWKVVSMRGRPSPLAMRDDVTRLPRRIRRLMRGHA